MQRLHQLFVHENVESVSVHWRKLKEYVLEATGLEPFAQVDDIQAPGFRYLHSSQRSDRFEILEGDAPYMAQVEWVSNVAAQLPPNAGPVEIDVASFLVDSRPDLGILIGGMGSGKSTTLRQVSAWLKKHVEARQLNCDKTAYDPAHPASANELLVRFLNPLASRLIDPEEEFSRFWDWALEQYDAQDENDQHNAVTVLEPAVQALRIKYGTQWRCNDADAVAYRRKELCLQVCANTEAKLDYIALRLDYYLTVICHGRRNRVCVILDNIDPLPPRLQRELLLAASRLQLNARCKVILAMRPLTYSLTHEQGATRTVKVIQHIGPSAIALIEDRVVRLIQDSQCPGLRLKILVDGNIERELTEQDFKAWVRQVIADIKSSRPAHRTADPSASDFIEGLCNNSLRSALLVAEKIFGSSNLPMVLPDEASPTTVLKNHEIIRAILLGRHSHFVSEINRVTDNIFDLGDAACSFSVTCKYRLLKELANTPGRGILLLDDLVGRMRKFGYDDMTIVEGVNAIISQIKRLAWSDMVVSYRTVDQPPGSRLSISRAGRFYIEHAIRSLEYVQEVHVDVLLPNDVSGSSYNHRSFIERVSSLCRFVRYVHEVDSREVKRVMADQDAKQRYYDTYGAALFSTEMVNALAQQVSNIANSMIRRAASKERAFELTQGHEQWVSLQAAIQHEDAPLIEDLQRLRPR